MFGDLLPHSPYLWVINSLKLPVTYSPYSGVLHVPLCMCVYIYVFTAPSPLLHRQAKICALGYEKNIDMGK